MKIFFILIVSLAVCVPRVSYAAISLTEVAWMGTSGSQFSEWIELYNDGTQEVDLSGYTFIEGTSTQVFVLTKKIAPNSYYLVERTTASAPDAVTGVDDDAGAWGGGGLSNGGERIALKSSSGDVIFDHDFSSGWPAGDSSEKRTMQLLGAQWVTATATPRTATLAAAETITAPSASSGTSSSQSSAKTASPGSSAHASQTPLSGVSLERLVLLADAGRARFSIAGSPVRFVGRATRGGEIVSPSNFVWSFGDGSQGEGGELEHVFTHAGFYNVVLNVKDGGDSAVARTTVRVEPALISIGAISPVDDSVEIVNGVAGEVNIGGFLVMASGQTFRFPADTILGARERIILDRSVTNFSFDENTEFSLLRPDRRRISGAGPVREAYVVSSSTPQATSTSVAEIRARLAAAEIQLQQMLVGERLKRATKSGAPKEEGGVPAVVVPKPPEEVIIEIPRPESTTATFIGFWRRLFGK